MRTKIAENHHSMFNCRRKTIRFLRESSSLLLWIAVIVSFQHPFSRNDEYCNAREQICENYDTGGNWDKYCQKREINATNFPKL